MSGNQLAGITFVNTKNSNLGMNNIHGGQDGVFVDAQSSQNIYWQIMYYRIQLISIMRMDYQ